MSFASLVTHRTPKVWPPPFYDHCRLVKDLKYCIFFVLVFAGLLHPFIAALLRAGCLLHRAAMLHPFVSGLLMMLPTAVGARPQAPGQPCEEAPQNDRRYRRRRVFLPLGAYTPIPWTIECACGCVHCIESYNFDIKYIFI